MEESSPSYKLYGYGLCKGKPTPKIAENKVQETLHFRYLKFLVKVGLFPFQIAELHGLQMGNILTTYTSWERMLQVAPYEGILEKNPASFIVPVPFAPAVIVSSPQIIIKFCGWGHMTRLIKSFGTSNSVEISFHLDLFE